MWKSKSSFRPVTVGTLVLMLACNSFVSFTPAPAQDGEVPRVWIYRDVSEEGAPDERTVPEKHFTPYLLMPASKANQIGVDNKFPISDISPDEEGTCLEFFFTLNGVDDFAVAGFMPGDILGNEMPLNLIDQGLVVGFGRPVYLKFRARTEEGKKVKARFESCGFASGRVRDGVRPPQTPEPDVTVLTDSWKDVTIDLTKKSSGLEKVASPLRVVVRANDNSGQNEVTIYVDDVRFEVGRPEK